MKSIASLVTLAVLAESGLTTARTITLPLQSRQQIPGHEGAISRAPHRRRGCSGGSSAPKSLNVPLADYYNQTDNQWYSEISVGTPPQKFKILWDTGSTDLLLPESNCINCGNHTLFNPSQSDTFSSLPGTEFDLTFATGAQTLPLASPEGATGHVVQDFVALGTFQSPNQTFLLADTYAPALDAMPIDGILGMGPFNTSSYGPSFYWTLVSSGQLDSPLFSFYIPPYPSTGAQITLGGIDTSKFTGDINTIALNPLMSAAALSYVIDQPAIYANGTLLGNSSDGSVPLPAGYTFLDTGSAFLNAPDFATAQQLYAQISPAIYQIDAVGAWGAPCDVLDAVAVALTFTFGGTDGNAAGNFTIPAENFNLGEYPGLPGICQAVFNNPLDPTVSPDGAPVWEVGSPLLKYYYTVWDGVNMTVGFADLV